MSSNPSPHSSPGLPEAVRVRLLERIKANQLELPVLPEVASQVVTLCNDANADTRQLAKLIQRDQAMAGHLMRMSNSPLYSPKVPLVSLDQVVARMGMKRVREMALVISCQSKVFQVTGFEALVKSQFRHSLATAAFSQEIARGRRWNVEEAFLCGLLHDVGWPLLLQELVDLHRSCECPIDMPSVEQAITALHSHIGGELVKRWALPARLSETILCHHNPNAATTAGQTAMMTSLADHLAHLTVPLHGTPRAISIEDIRSHALLAPLNIYPDELEALLAQREPIRTMIEALA